MRWLEARRLWRCPLQECPEISIAPGPGERRHTDRTEKRVRPLAITFDDGREVLHGRKWVERKIEVWERDKRRCTACGKLVDRPGSHGPNEAEVHHVNRRGFNGWKRDDRMPALTTLCHACHLAAGPRWMTAKIPETGNANQNKEKLP
jgi:5-methylcytosine-specific restriction endonuclease McrA